jgi:hypothetical protein
MGLGVEKRVRSMYGEQLDERQDQKTPFSHVAAYLALLLSFIALVTIISIYSGSGIGQMGSMQEHLARTQSQVEELQAQVSSLERRSELGQQAVIDSLLVDVSSKLRYLAEQPLTPEQQQELRAALSSAAPDGQGAEPQEAPSAEQPGAVQ